MHYIPIHNLDVKSLKRVGFDVIALNDPADRNYDGVEAHRHNFYELMIYTKGGGIHEIDFKEYEIEKNSLHFVSPTQVHRLKSAAARGYVFCFSEEFMTLNEEGDFLQMYPFYDFNNYVPVIKLDKELFKEINEVVEILNINLSKDSTFRSDILRCYFQVILLRIKEHFINSPISKASRISSGHPKVQEFKKLINTNYLKHYSSFQYADLLHISPNHLNSICKKETSKTATELIHERILLEAKRLLCVTKLNVKEISNHLNFDTVPYFTRFFKKHVGQTPLDYRNSFSK